MSDANPAAVQTPEAKSDKPAEKRAKSSAVLGIVKVFVPALLAAAAAYFGSRHASAHAVNGHAEPDVHAVHPVPPPGPTLALEPFLVTVFDAQKRSHPMKMSIAIEFEAGMHDDPKSFTPRIRDTILAHLRTLSYEQVADSSHIEKLREELVERCRKVGAVTADKVLVTDFVVQ